RRMFGPGAALLGAALIALNHGHVRFTQEAQAFALEGLLVISTVGAAWDWISERRTSSAVATIIFGVLAGYTHYVLLAVVPVFALWGVAALRREPRALLRWIGLNAAIALAFLPQLPTQIHQFIQEDAAHHGHFPLPMDWQALAHELTGAAYLVPLY